MLKRAMEITKEALGSMTGPDGKPYLDHALRVMEQMETETPADREPWQAGMQKMAQWRDHRLQRPVLQAAAPMQTRQAFRKKTRI